MKKLLLAATLLFPPFFARASDHRPEAVMAVGTAVFMAGLGVAYRSQARDTKSEILDGAAAFGCMLGGMAMILCAHAIVEGFDGK